MAMIEDMVENVVEKKSNLLKDAHPHLLEEWDYEKNSELGIDIDKITKGSQTHSFWICKKCESGYSIRTSARTLGQNCPYCTGKKVNHTNCLSTTHPKLLEVWDYEKNTVQPSEVTKGNKTKVWWICPKCESSYSCSIANKVHGKACSYCHGKKVNHTNSLASLNPELASEWHPTLNGERSPDNITSNAHQKAWWLGRCGHEWEATINNRNAGKGCIYCSSISVLIGFNDMWATNSKLASMLLNPEDGYKYTQNSNVVLEWRCSCGETVRRSVNKASYRGTKCRDCAKGASKAEKMMNYILKKLKQDFEREKSFKWSNRKRYDFYLPKYNMIIETHGGQHYNGSFEKVGGRTLVEEQVNDRYKYVMSLYNGIDKYIVVDCRISEVEWIRNSILNSELANILDLSKVDWEDIRNFILFNKGE